MDSTLQSNAKPKTAQQEIAGTFCATRQTLAPFYRVFVISPLLSLFEFGQKAIKLLSSEAT